RHHRSTGHRVGRGTTLSPEARRDLEWRSAGSRAIRGLSVRRAPHDVGLTARDGECEPPAPMERRELEADAVVVGSALGGLVAGAILARRGKRVVVLEHADTVGGRGGSVPHDGYWIDFGHRDGHDVGDCQVAWHHGVEAAREAGVEVTLRRVTAPLRVHHLPDGGVTTGGDWSAAGLAAMACAALSPGADSVEELRALVGRLAAAEPDEVARAIPETLGAWLGAHTRSAEVRQAILLMAAVVFHSHPEEASAGRFMQFLQRRAAGGAFIPDDGEVGGMQGLIEPWARALRTHGGEIALGWKPVESVVDGGGYQITSLTSRHAAPAGRHLLSLVMARFFRGGSTAGQPWTAARAALDEAIAYLRRFYADLDACLEWSAYQYVTAPQSMSWAW